MIQGPLRPLLARPINDDFDHQLISLFIWPDMTHFDPSKSLDENPYEYELSEHKLASTKVA